MITGEVKCKPKDGDNFREEEGGKEGRIKRKIRRLDCECQM